MIAKTQQKTDICFFHHNDTLVGRFEEGGGRVSFEYEPDATYPISLSLPLDGRWHEHAPAAFLEGLLPEEGAQRLYMMNSIGARSTDAFDLLDGVDSTGGLVFTTTDAPIVPVADAGIARELDIEAQMQRIYDSGYAWWNGDTRNRFSLAGNQGKFSLSRIGGMWFWPNAALPSTHIIKPDGQRIPSVAAVEHASMEIARQLGLPVANTTTIRFGEREGLLVERFDRVYDARKPSGVRSIRIASRRSFGRPRRRFTALTTALCRAGRASPLPFVPICRNAVVTSCQALVSARQFQVDRAARDGDVATFCDGIILRFRKPGVGV